MNDKEYFIDLLLFHRRLRSLVAVELKIGEFQPEHIGKMQFYLALVDDTGTHGGREPLGEPPSIGILICKSKDKTIVEYALKESSKPIGVVSTELFRPFRPNFAAISPAQRKLPGSWVAS